MTKNKKGQTDGTAEVPSTRWWESYLVRYFIGFIGGAVCVSVLVADLGMAGWVPSVLSATTGTNIKPDWGALLAGLSLLGLGYCYVVSSPITVLHTGRYGRWIPDAHSRHFWFGWLGAMAFNSLLPHTSPAVLQWIFLALGTAALVWLPVSASLDGLKLPAHWEFDNAQRRRLQARPVLLLGVQALVWSVVIWSVAGRALDALRPDSTVLEQRLWLFAAPVLWIGVMQYVVLARLIAEPEKMAEFYSKLFRARRQKNARDVRDTYTHLREHSNSVFIVVVELAVLAFLLAARRAAAAPSGDLSEFAAGALFGLAVWLTPTLFLWARANELERRFGEDPSAFLSDRPPESKSASK